MEYCASERRKERAGSMRRRGGGYARRTASWCRAALARAAWRARSWQRSTRASTWSPTLASASACRCSHLYFNGLVPVSLLSSGALVCTPLQVLVLSNNSATGSLTQPFVTLSNKLCVQTAVIEFARNELGLADANSAEFEPATPTPVVVFMPEGSTTHKGGTMRLGSRRTILQTMDCITARLYQVPSSTAFP